MPLFDCGDKAQQAPDSFNVVAAWRHGIQRRFMELRLSRWRMSPADDSAAHHRRFNCLIPLN